MLRLTKNIEEATCITHSGKFHADEVFATVFLEDYLEEVVLARVNDITFSTNALIYDVGGGKFDHHQADSKVRKNGIPYASLGLLFENFGVDYLEKKKVKNTSLVKQKMEEEFILQIDAIDNGVFPKVETSYKLTNLSSVIELFNPTYKEKVDSDLYFLQAVEVAKQIWQKKLKSIIDKVDGYAYLEEKICSCEGEILLLEEYVPFMEYLLSSNLEQAKKILYVITPSNREGYTIHAVNESLDSFKNRLDFPQSWAGLRNDELERVCGVKSALFCHKNLFLASTKTKESAIALAKKSIFLQKEK